MIETTALPRSVKWEEIVYQDRYQQLHRVVADFDGFTKEYFVSEKGQRAAILVVRDDQVLLARQYRVIVNQVALEIPGGKIEEGETPADSAVRECLEETGVEAVDPRLLVCYHPSLDVMNNYTHIYYTEQCHATNASSERYTWIPLSRCLQMVFAQKITDVLTIVALLAYQVLRSAPAATGNGLSRKLHVSTNASRGIV